VDAYTQVLLAATSNQPQDSGASQKTASPASPRPHDFQTAASSHQVGQEQMLDTNKSPEIVPFQQDTDMLLLSVPDGHAATNNGNHTNAASFVQSLWGIDSAHWLLEDDFDISVFDNLNYFPTPGLEVVFTTDTEEQSIATQGTLSAVRRPMPRVLDLRNHWYTQVPLMASGFAAGSRAMTPRDPGDDSENIDETYRAKLASKLRPPLRDEPLPTIEFMVCSYTFFSSVSNACIESLHPPVLHALQHCTSYCPRAYLSANHRGCSSGAFNMFCGCSVSGLRSCS